MKRTISLHHWQVFWCMLALLFATSACKKQEPPHEVKHATPSPVGTSQTVLKKTFSLKTSVTFPFEIPAHAAQPHLHGSFESYAGQVHGASDDTSNIDFVLLNDEQYADYTAKRPSEALISAEATHSQSVNFDLPPSLDQPVKYYLVFSSAPGGAKKVVQAEFTVEF